MVPEGSQGVPKVLYMVTEGFQRFLKDLQSSQGLLRDEESWLGSKGLSRVETGLIWVKRIY